MRKVKFIIYIFSIIAILIILGFRTNINSENKYNLSVNNYNNIFLSIGYYFIKPLIEIYLDSRLENKDIFTKIKSQKFYNQVIQKVQIKAGDGKKIICGQKIKINLLGNDIQNRLEFEYQVGMSDMPILNIAPIGMKKGENSIINIPSYLFTTLFDEIDEEIDEEIRKKNYISISIEIVDILDSFPEEMNEIENIQLFTDGSNNKVAKMCGDKINLMYDILDISGNKLYSNKISFKIGAKKVPIGLELSSIGLQPGIRRVAILNGNLINNEYNKELKIVKLYSEE